MTITKGRSAVSTGKQLPKFPSISCRDLQQGDAQCQADGGGAIYRNVSNQSKRCDITQHLTCSNTAVSQMPQCASWSVHFVFGYLYEVKKKLICAPRPSFYPSVCHLLGSKLLDFHEIRRTSFTKSVVKIKLLTSHFTQGTNKLPPAMPTFTVPFGLHSVMLFSICQSVTVRAGKPQQSYGHTITRHVCTVTPFYTLNVKNALCTMSLVFFQPPPVPRL